MCAYMIIANHNSISGYSCLTFVFCIGRLTSEKHARNRARFTCHSTALLIIAVLAFPCHLSRRTLAITDNSDIAVHAPS